MTNYIYRAQVIATDKDAGNYLANLSAPYPSPDAETGTFDDTRKCEPLAWYAEMPCTESLKGTIDAINADAPYTDERLAFMRDRGLTEEQWAMAKSILVCSVYQYIVDGQIVPDTDALNDLATANGYAILEPEEDV